MRRNTLFCRLFALYYTEYNLRMRNGEAISGRVGEIVFNVIDYLLGSVTVISISQIQSGMSCEVYKLRNGRSMWVVHHSFSLL